MAAPQLPRDEQHEGIHVLSEAEAWQTFDKSAQYYLGISGDEFLRRWRAGEYPDPDGTPVMQLWALLPLIGVDP
jgi:hypothetical protein